MNKKAKYIGIAAAVALTIAAVCGGIYAWKASKKDKMVQQQNYVASKLIENGEYEQGRILAAQTEQMKQNAVSERLLVLAAGFQTDYEIGIIYANKYLESGEDKIISSAKEAYRNALDAIEEGSDWSAESYQAQAEKVKQEILPLLLQVQNSISIKKNSESMDAIINFMMGDNVSADMAVLEDDNSLLSQKTQVTYAVQTRNYGAAYEKAEALYLESGTLENRAVLANLAAVQGTGFSSDDETKALQDKITEQRSELSQLETQYAQETSNSKRNKIAQKIEKAQEKIQETQQEMNAIPSLKAINFMETATPVTEQKTAAYKIELSQLYYRAGKSDKAKEFLIDIIMAGRATEPVSLVFFDFLDKYTDTDGFSANRSNIYAESNNISVLWKRLAQMLGFVEDAYTIQEQSFYNFVLNTLDEIYNGLIIRSVDATDYPIVRLTVNVSMELEQPLTKKNFTLVEMGEELKEFELLDTDGLQDMQDMSVMLVVDRSGSMGGQPMEDTKQAVTNFVKTIDESIAVGLVAFDSSAQLIKEITTNKNSVVQGITSLYASGGTDIYSGLELAGKSLETQTGRRVIILLSDGADGSAWRIDEVLDELARKDIYVYSIGFGGADTEYLSYIARKCGGKFIQADSSSVLGEIYSSVGEYMTNDYVIEFHVAAEEEKFTRTVKVMADVNDAFDEREYSVGVPYDAIKAEEEKTPLADYFQQVGGSRME